MVQDDSPMTATGIVKAKQPKFQVAVPYGVRNVLGIDDLDKDEVALLEAEFTLKRIEKKD
jgi:bifunctional DNA-binding transcriptional regulator/antitoxin component of YhaV-PrlF toxin-antitoxin module